MTIFFLSTNNTYSYFKLKVLPPKRVIINFILSASLGALSGARLTYLIDTNTSKKIIAFILILVVLKLFFSPKTSEEMEQKKLSDTKIFLTGFLGAFISSISGLGGGVIFIPLLISFAKVRMKSVSPYSNLAMVTATFMGAIPHLLVKTKLAPGFPKTLTPYFLGNINFSIVLIFILLGVVSSKLGIRFNERVNADTKRYLLASLLFFLSIKMFMTVQQ